MKLNEYLDTLTHSEYKEMNRRFREDLGISRSSLSQWLKGSSKPNPLICADISNLTKGAVTVKELRPDIDWDKIKDAL
tara:strand:+ start:125 stop:358 length:234 start_codon:yes stop_codon:yes gene_type:complete